jgi:ABC-type polar amino acid transport system ATPase subunit
MADKVGLGDKLDAYPAQLSGGRSSAWRSPVRWR